MALSVGFRILVSQLRSCYPSYGAPTLTPVGLSPTERASLRWTHNVCSGWRVQPVNATLRVVYRQAFQSPRASWGVGTIVSNCRGAGLNARALGICACTVSIGGAPAANRRLRTRCIVHCLRGRE